MGVLVLILVGAFLVLVWIARSSRYAEQQRKEKERIDRAVALSLKLDEDRPTWGGVVSTEKTKCPRCEAWSILKVYQSGNVELHCPSCGHQTEV